MIHNHIATMAPPQKGGAEVLRKSIFDIVLFRSLGITLVPLVVLLTVVALFICMNYRRQQETILVEQVEAYTMEVKGAIEQAVSITEFIQSSPYIRNGINKSYEHSSEIYDFVDTLNVYVAGAIGIHSNISVRIYFSNETLYESRYLYRMSVLSASEEVLETLHHVGIYFAWDKELYSDENGNRSLVFYKKFPFSDESIIECTVSLPTEPENIQVIESDKLPGTDDRDHIFKSINENFMVQGTLDSGDFVLRYISIVSAVILFIGSVALIISLMTKSVVSKTTQEITAFIDRLDKQGAASLEYETDISQGTSRELAIIKNALADFSRKIRTMESEQKNVEIELTQSKINPHMLYNSLAAIRLKAYTSGEQGIVEMIDQLSDYYHMTLNSGSNITTLQREVEVLRRYVHISAYGSGVEYEFTAEVPEKVVNSKIPHLILQPFVENSIRHGLSGMYRGGKVSLTCVREHNDLVVTISDNGKGIKEEKLEQLNDLKHTMAGYGIRNVYTRLQLLYGEDSSISFSNIPEGGARVTVRFQCF